MDESVFGMNGESPSEVPSFAMTLSLSSLDHEFYDDDFDDYNSDFDDVENDDEDLDDEIDALDEDGDEEYIDDYGGLDFDDSIGYDDFD